MYTPRRLVLHKELDFFLSRNVVIIVTQYDCISEEYEQNKKIYNNSLKYIPRFKFSEKCKTVAYRIRSLMYIFNEAASRKDRIRCVTKIFNEILTFLWWFEKKPGIQYASLFETMQKKLLSLKSDGFPNADLFYRLIFLK